MKELIIKVDVEKMDIEGNAPVVDRPQELIRSKDCKHYRINTVYPGTNMIMTYCAKTGIAVSKPDWYCADGERRTDDA